MYSHQILFSVKFQEKSPVMQRTTWNILVMFWNTIWKEDFFLFFWVGFGVIGGICVLET